MPDNKPRTPKTPTLPPQEIFQIQKESGDRVPAVWCSLHDRHPSECFELHHWEIYGKDH